MNDWRAAAFAALIESDPATKVALTRAAAQAADTPGEVGEIHPFAPLVTPSPGRPARLALVHPSAVARRGLGSVAGRAALIHAIAHIEFNAINLALDAVCRFGAMPAGFYTDWMRVAAEEAHHFTLLADHLEAAYGHAYGDFPAHDGLWSMAQKTADDVLARMALVPRLLEARGLDVTPAMRAGLAAHGDEAAARILDVILADEVGHVAVGNRWFAHFCAARGEAPAAAFERVRDERGAPPVRPPLNVPARLAAGFSAQELAAWGA
jgi:uncharacterized ferritin-like protein (DUF455 family)